VIAVARFDILVRHGDADIGREYSQVRSPSTDTRRYERQFTAERSLPTTAMFNLELSQSQPEQTVADVGYELSKKPRADMGSGRTL